MVAITTREKAINIYCMGRRTQNPAPLLRGSLVSNWLKKAGPASHRLTVTSALGPQCRGFTLVCPVQASPQPAFPLTRDPVYPAQLISSLPMAAVGQTWHSILGPTEEFGSKNQITAPVQALSWFPYILLTLSQAGSKARGRTTASPA